MVFYEITFVLNTTLLRQSPGTTLHFLITRTRFSILSHNVIFSIHVHKQRFAFPKICFLIWMLCKDKGKFAPVVEASFHLNQLFTLNTNALFSNSRTSLILMTHLVICRASCESRDKPKLYGELTKRKFS